MGEELIVPDNSPDFGDAFFVPSHLTKGLLAVGIGVAAAGISVGAFGYAANQFRKVSTEEIAALFHPPQSD